MTTPSPSSGERSQFIIFCEAVGIWEDFADLIGTLDADDISCGSRVPSSKVS